MLISRISKKCHEVSIKTRSAPASLSFKGQATKHPTVKWSLRTQVRVEFYLLLALISTIRGAYHWSEWPAEVRELLILELKFRRKSLKCTLLSLQLCSPLFARCTLCDIFMIRGGKNNDHLFLKLFFRSWF